MQQQKNIDNKITSLPSGFSLRHATQTDLPAITDLFVADDIAQLGRARTTLSGIQAMLSSLDIDMARDTWLVLSPEGRPVGFSQLGHIAHIRFDTRGTVHPDYRGLGIGRTLLQSVEARACEHLSETAPDIRVTLSCWANSSNTSKQHLLEHLGFQSIRQFWIMQIDLPEVPAPVGLPTGITIQTMQPGMEHAVHQALEDGFADHWGHLPFPFEQWQHWELSRENFDPSLWFLAMDGDTIAALNLCADESGEGWVNDLAVLRPWRRRGLGLALLQHAFRELYARGLHTVYLNVDAQSLTGATRLYTRAGMHVARTSNTYEKELRAGKELSTQFLE